MADVTPLLPTTSAYPEQDEPQLNPPFRNNTFSSRFFYAPPRFKRLLFDITLIFVLSAIRATFATFTPFLDHSEGFVQGVYSGLVMSVLFSVFMAGREYGKRKLFGDAAESTDGRGTNKKDSGWDVAEDKHAEE